MNYEAAQALNPQKFKRYVGIRPQTFKQMLKVLEKERSQASKAGRPPTLSLPDQLLVALQYWREYRTYFHIGALIYLTHQAKRNRQNGAGVTFALLILVI